MPHRTSKESQVVVGGRQPGAWQGFLPAGSPRKKAALAATLLVVIIIGLTGYRIYSQTQARRRAAQAAEAQRRETRGKIIAGAEQQYEQLLADEGATEAKRYQEALSLARTYQQEGNQELANRYFKAAEKHVQPEYALDAQVGIARTAEALGNTQEAIAYYEKVVAAYDKWAAEGPHLAEEQRVYADKLAALRSKQR